MKAISIRVGHNSRSKAAGLRRHDTRQGRVPGYVDSERSHLNSVVLEPMKEAALRDECERRRSQRPGLRAMRSDAAVSTNGVLTFGHEAQKVLEGLPVEEQDRRILEAVEAAVEHMGTTLTGLVVHRDESSLHAHFQCPAVRTDGHPVSKRLDRNGTSWMQDVAAKPFEDLGITRGIKKRHRQAMGQSPHKWIHKTVDELHEHLVWEIEEARQTAAREAEKAAKNERLAAQTRAKIDAGTGDLKKLQKRLKTYAERVDKARQAEAKALAIFKAKPKARTVETVAKREKRAFGLLPDRVETKQVKAYTPQDFRRMAAQAGREMNDQHAARESLLDARESKISRLEKQGPKMREEAARAKQEAAAAKAEASEARKERDGYIEEVSRAGQALRGLGRAIMAVPGAEKALEAIPGRVGDELRLGLMIGHKSAHKAAQAAQRPERDNGPELGM